VARGASRLTASEAHTSQHTIYHSQLACKRPVASTTSNGATVDYVVATVAHISWHLVTDNTPTSPRACASAVPLVRHHASTGLVLSDKHNTVFTQLQCVSQHKYYNIVNYKPLQSIQPTA
jgi:hypothetical protein